MVITVTPADQELARLAIVVSDRLGEKPDPRMEAIANAVPLRKGDKVRPRSNGARRATAN